MKRIILLGLMILGGCGVQNNPSSPVAPSPTQVIPTPTATTYVYLSPTPILSWTPTSTSTPTSTPTSTSTPTNTATPNYTTTPLPFWGHVVVNETNACSGTAKAYVTLVSSDGSITSTNTNVTSAGFQVNGSATGTYTVAVTVVYGNLISGVFYASTTQTGSLSVPGSSIGNNPGQVGVNVNCVGSTMTCLQGPF